MATTWRQPSCPAAPGTSYCRVNADGVLAEWGEVTPASAGQATVVLFIGGASGGDALDQGRPLAGKLAWMTGARVLSVASRSLEGSLTAYSWLLGEGCDLGATV